MRGDGGATAHGTRENCLMESDDRAVILRAAALAQLDAIEGERSREIERHLDVGDLINGPGPRGPFRA